MVARSYGLIFIFLILSSCVNPTGQVDSHKKILAEKYSQNIYLYKNENRQMKAVWTGRPELRPVVFVHGSPGDFEGWSEFLLNPDLQNKFHLIAVDRPGYGGSGAGFYEGSLQKQAADVLSVLQFNTSGLPAILVGHSYGAPVIARMAADHAQKIAGLVLVAGSLDPALEDFKWYQNFAIWPLTRWLVPESLRVCNDEIMDLENELKNLKPLLGQITATTVIIHGTEDDLVPVENVKFMKEQLRPEIIQETQVIAGLNHFIPWKRPDLITAAVLKIEISFNK